MGHPLDDNFVYDSEKLELIADRFYAFANLLKQSEVNNADENLSQEEKDLKAGLIGNAAIAVYNVLKNDLANF